MFCRLIFTAPEIVAGSGKLFSESVLKIKFYGANTENICRKKTRKFIKKEFQKKTCFAFLQQLKKASEIIFFPSSIASKIKKVWHFFVVVAAKQSQTKQNGDKHKQKQNPG